MMRVTASPPATAHAAETTTTRRAPAVVPVGLVGALVGDPAAHLAAQRVHAADVVVVALEEARKPLLRKLW